MTEAITSSATTVLTAPIEGAPAAFIRALFGDETRGYIVLAFIPIGDGAVIHRHIPVGQTISATHPIDPWAVAERAIIAHTATHNCYVCVALNATDAQRVAGKMEYRTRAMVAHLRWLYAELDEAPLPPSLPEPTILVETSPSRFHAWWRLHEPIDVARAEDLLRRIADACGIGHQAVDVTRVLRIPGTPNRKPGRADAVVRQAGGSGQPVNLAFFTALPPASASATTHTPGLALPPLGVDDTAGVMLWAWALPRLSKRMLRVANGDNAEYHGDASRADAALILALRRLGLTDAEAARAFAASPRGPELRARKGDGRFDELVHRMLATSRVKLTEVVRL